MYPAQTTYHRAGSVAEAVQLLADNEGAKVLAGGHSLIPMMKLRLAAPAVLVDIGHIGALKGIEATDGGLCIGALTTFAEIAASDLVKQHAPLLAEAAAQVGDPTVRNRATIGGNVSHGDPQSDSPTVLTALCATLNVTGPGGDRSIAVADFPTGLLENALSDCRNICSAWPSIAEIRLAAEPYLGQVMRRLWRLQGLAEDGPP